MSTKFPQYTNTVFPNSLDSYIVFTDVNASNKALVDQYYTYMNSNDFTSATALLANNPSLNYVIINAKTLQIIYDALMAIETTYTTDVVETIGGALHWGDTYSDATQYDIFYIVDYNGLAYMAKSKPPIGTIPTNGTYWKQMGFRGLSGTGMAFYPSYSETQDYKVADCVPVGNKLYVCIQASTGKNPPDYSAFWTSIITVPTQVIWSNTQPSGQEVGEIWCKTNSTDTSYEMYRCTATDTYIRMYPKTTASFVTTTDGSNVQTKLNNLPTALKNPNAITFTGGATGSYDGSATMSVAIPTTLPANGGTSASCSGNAATATLAANTTSIAGALTVSTSEPTTVLPAGTLWAVV